MAVKLKVLIPGYRPKMEQRLVQIRLDVELFEKIRKMAPKGASCPAKVKAIIEYVINNPDIHLDLGS